MAFKAPARPGAQIPRSGIEVEVPTHPDPALELHSCIGLRLSVTVAGSLLVTYMGSPNDEVTLNYPAVGSYIEPGEFKSVRFPAAGAATLSPTDTIVVLNK